MNRPLNKNLDEIIDQNYAQISNLSLLLTKYVACWDRNWQYGQPEKKGHEKEGKEPQSFSKAGYMRQVIKTHYDKNTYQEYFARWKLLLNSLNAEQMIGKTLWRLVVGLGSGSVLETSITLHHILGVPFIPGSALKGVLSAYYLQKNSETEEFAMNEDEKYIKFFGNHKQKGKIIFFDAYPTSFPELEMDIMTPHYPDYYGKDKSSPPADWSSPNPIPFIALSPDTEFLFAFKTQEIDLLPEIKSLLTESLQNSGIGAKTSVGYGYFKDLTDFLAESPITTQKIKEKEPQPLPGYLKSEDKLRDEYLRPDGTMKSEEEYEKYLQQQGKKYNKERRRVFAKAKKWYEKNKK